MRTDHVNVTGMELAFDYRENVMYAKTCRSEHISVNRTGHGLIMGNWWEPIVPRFETPIKFPHIATEYSKTTIACRLRKLRAQKKSKEMYAYGARSEMFRGFGKWPLVFRSGKCHDLY